MRAFDAAGLESLPWPYLVADGGQGDESPPYEPAADLGAQDGTNTPFVTRVDFAASSLPAGEVSDQAAIFPATVHVDRRGMNLEEIKVRIQHPLLPGQPYERAFPIPGGQQQQDQHSITIDLSPYGGEFGWGHYTLNVQVRVKDPQTPTTYISDWWPRLRSH
jgi:hypothetical protein